MTALPMAGRADELRAIRLAWERVVADAGRSQVVVISGEAGIGKSRLITEALAALSPRPACVLAGQARTHAPAPYDWMASALSGRSLAGLEVPDDALAWLTQRPDAPPRRFAPGALLRVAVDATRSLLGAGPGVLVVEDLHDLDPASLTLVADLATADPLPALVLVTSRTSEQAAFPELAARVLARVSGAPRAQRRHLAPLTPAEVAAVIEAGFGAVPAPEVVLATHQRTGGNAFWLSELVTAYRGAGAAALATAPLPDHLVRLVANRLAGESEETARLARVAALLGDDVATADLDRLCDLDVEPAVRRLVDLGLLVLGPDGEPRFGCPLLREAIAGTALAATRSTVYAGAAELAAERGADAAVAGYARALGRHGDAAAAGLRAARTRLAAGAPAEALAAAETALAGAEALAAAQALARAQALVPAQAVAPAEVLAEAGDAPDRAEARAAAGSTPAAGIAVDSGADLLPAVRAAVAAALAAGRYGAAAGHAERWRGLATDPADLAAAHRASAEISWHLGRTAEQRAHLDAAGDASPEQAAAQASERLGAERPAEALAYAERALAADPCLAGALVTRGAAELALGERERGEATLREARRLAEERGDLVALARAIEGLTTAELDRLGEPAAWRAFDQSLATLARHGLEHRAGLVVAAGVRLAVRCGHLERARELVTARLPIEPDRTERAVLAAAAGLLALEAGDDQYAVRLCERAQAEAEEVDRPRARRLAGHLGVAIAARTGGAAEALHALAAHAASYRGRSVADAARWALRAGAPADQVRELAGEHADAALRRALAAAAGADEEAVASIGAEPGGAAWRAADGHIVLARSLLRLGRNDEARGHAERATILLRRWPGWRRDEAADLLAAARTGAELTAREREVLGCVAAGMSNQQVARSLGISIRTVTVHVSNVLRKTGSASRTEAALWAVKHGLAL